MLKDGRIAWPVFSAALFSTATIVLTDYVWRTVSLPISVISGIGVALLLLGNIAIVLAARSKPRG